MENKSTIKKSADARVVQAVRRLKSTRQKDDNMEVRKNQEDIKHPTIIKGKPGYIDNNNQGKDKKNSSNLALINPLPKKTIITNNDSIVNHNSIILNNNSNNGSSIPKSRDINKSQSKIKIKKVKKDDKNNKLVLSRNNNNNNIELEYDKNLSNSSNIFIDNFKLSLEDIKEEDDEGRSVTSKDYSLCEKRLRVSDKNLKLYKAEENEKNQNIEENNNDDDSFDFTEEEYLTQKMIKIKQTIKNNKK